MAENSGLSKGGLDRMHRVLAAHVERGDLAGLVGLVSRADDVHVEICGTLSTEGGAPMRRDTIFRIASLTKLVAAAAAMMLVEDSRSDSTTRSIPGYRNWRTGVCCDRSRQRSTTRCRPRARSRCAIS